MKLINESGDFRHVPPLRATNGDELKKRRSNSEPANERRASRLPESGEKELDLANYSDEVHASVKKTGLHLDVVAFSRRLPPRTAACTRTRSTPTGAMWIGAGGPSGAQLPERSRTEPAFDADRHGSVRHNAYFANPAINGLGSREDVAAVLEGEQMARHRGGVWLPRPTRKDRPWRSVPWHSMPPIRDVHVQQERWFRSDSPYAIGGSAAGLAASASLQSATVPTVR